MNFSMRSADQTTYVEAQGDIVAGIGVALTNLAAQVADKRVVIDMGRVRAINSIGCAEWARALKPFASSHLVEFVQCSIPFVDYCNLMPAMLGDQGAGASALIKSFFAPYYCQDCSDEFKVLVELEVIRKSRQLPTHPCPLCQKTVKAEVESEDYLIFLDRTL